MGRRLKRMMLLFFVALLIIPSGLITTVAKADEGEGPVTVYHETFGDGLGIAKQSGDAKLEVTDKDFEGNDNGKAVYVSERSNDWDGIDIPFESADMKDGKTYTILVTGYVDEDVNVPEEAQALLQNIDSYEGLYSSGNYEAGEVFVLEGEYTVDIEKDHAFRIQSNESGKEIPFYIGDILITTDESQEDPNENDDEGNNNDDQEEIPEDERVAAFTDFEDGTTQGWEPRGENEKLTVVDETAKNGNHSLLVENRQASSDAAIIEFLDKIHPGNEYNISLWVKLAPGEKATSLQLSAAETVNGETSYYPPVIAPTTVTSDDWVLLEGTYNVPAAIEELSFYVEEEYDEDQTTGVSYYIDDFKAEVFVSETGVQTNLRPLKEIYEDKFLIGNAVESPHFTGRTLELLTHHHNLVTAENVMKPENYYSNGAFDSSGPDRFLRNAVDNGLKIHGHVLLWHSQSEDSLYQDADGEPLSREEALANMHEHIENVMRSADEIAGDSIISWDVVNEALDGDWSNPEDWESILRPASGWLQAIGPDYMYEAFLKARQVADELGRYDMELYYNDYNDHVQEKAKTMYHMVKDINERYAAEYPEDERKLISGVGMQGHYATNVNIDNVRESLERFISLGVKVGVTELDVGAGGSTLTEEEELQQAYFYAQLFSLYKEHADHMSRVTLWGLSDGESWRSENSPLLFDRNLQAKLAYHALVDPDKFIEENEPEKVLARAGNAAYGSPTIDGEIDEIWNEAPVLPIDRFQDAHNVSTGEARVLWDDKNLYVKVDVNDTELDKTGSDAHEQDSVEVFIDEQNTKAASFGEGHGQYRVNFDNEQSFNPADISEGFESVTVVNGTKYTVLMKIPFKTTDVENGHTIGFDVQINDAANGSRTGVAIWNDQTGMGWSDPSVFGNLKLIGSTDEQSQIDELQKEIEELEQRISDLERDNASKAEEIKELQDKVQELTQSIQDLKMQSEEDNESLQQQIDQLTKEINELSDLVDRLLAQIEDGKTPGDDNGGTPGDDNGGTPGDDNGGTPGDDNGGTAEDDEVSAEDETKDGEKSEGDQLPQTATNTFNWLMIGLAMLVLGASFIFITKRKKSINKA